MRIYMEEKEVTAVNLALELEGAVITHELHADESIYVFEDGWYPFWISMNASLGYVCFKTHTRFKASSSQLQRLELCNALNLHSYLVTAAMQDEQLLLDHVLIYRDGLLRETFIRACRQFSRNIQRGMDRLDPDNAVALRPGQTEPSDESAS